MDNIKFCKKNEFSDLIKFLKKNWVNKNTKFKNEKFLKWQYFNTKYKKYNFLIIKRKNKIKACLGLIFNKNSKKNIVWFNLWLVDRKNRENVNGLDLIKYLTTKYKKSIVMTTGINPNTAFIYKALGFKIKNLEQYFIVNKKIKKFNLIKFKKNKNDKFINYQKSSYEIMTYNKIDFLLKNRFLLKFQKNFYKDIKYYVNRYQSHPSYSYLFFVIRKNKKILGFFVGRECKYLKSKALRLVEYFGSINHIANLKYNLIQLLSKKKYEYLDFYNLGFPKKILIKAGFIRNNFLSSVIIPNYFEPFVKKNIKIQCVWWPQKVRIPIFKGDGDQDRPNI